jgi:uncharacterized DUF497 family protein
MDEFEWDEVKAQTNFAKHRVSFEATRLVFEDIFAVERFDFGGDPREARYVRMGVANGVLLTVVYTERGDRIRIISARKATRHEQEEYYRSQTAD